MLADNSSASKNQRYIRTSIFLVCAVLFTFSQAIASSRGITIAIRQSEAPGAPVVQEVELYKSSYALVIGNDAYNNGWPPLANAVKDAELVAQVLEERGFEVELHTNLVSDQLKSIFERFLILKGDDPESRLFVWYSGHGHTEAGEGYLIPIDAPVPSVGGLFKLASTPLRDFGRYMRQALSKHVYAVFDSCFAGTVFSSQRDMPPAAITLATTMPVRQFLTSGDADQTVSDDGTFRTLFVRALRGEERSDLNNDGYITASELGMFLGDRITNLTESMQTPRYGKLRDKNYDRGDFVFKLPETSFSTTEAQSVSSGVSRSSDAAEIAFWNSIKNSDSATQFDAYLRTYPQGAFSRLAMVRKQDFSKVEKPKIAVVRDSFQVRYMDQDYLALRTANVRNGPFKDATRVGQLHEGDQVWVIGEAKMRGSKWYRIARDGLDFGFVYSPLLERITRAEVLQVDTLTPEHKPVTKAEPVVETRSLPDNQQQVEKSSQDETKTDRWAAFADELSAELTNDPVTETVAIEISESTAVAIEPGESANAELRSYLDAAEKGDFQSQFSLGHMYQNGIKTEINLEQAFYWYSRAAMNGDVRAQLNLGWMYENGKGTPVNLPAAAEWYKQAASQGSEDAKQKLSLLTP